MKNIKKYFRSLSYDIVALVLGAVTTLAFAPYEIFPLAVFTPAGLLAMWLNVTSKRAFWLGFLFGIGLFGAGVYWVYISIHDVGGVPALIAGLITCGMITVLSLYPGCVGYLLNRYFPENNTHKLLCAFPAIWVFSEIVRCWLFTGFPWLFLGYSQTNSPLHGYAPIFSVYGVSLAVTLTSALLVSAFLQLKQEHYRALYYRLFALISIWIIGGLLCLIPWTTPQGNPIQIGMVQGDIPQTLKWSPEHLQLSFDRYIDLTKPLWGKDKIIIWPEAAIPMPLQDITNFINALDKQAKETNTHLILGIPIQSPKGDGYYNAIISVGAERNVYLKRLLVPFGEYTPFASILQNTLKILNLPLPEGARGSHNQKPFIVDGIKIIPSICYEIAYPELMLTNDPTTGLLLTVSNDAWFGKSNAQAQHLQMAAMRAQELQRPLVFVSNDGITATITPNGKIANAAPSFQATVLHGTVQPTTGLTPWMRNGTDPITIILLCLLFTAWRAQRKHASMFFGKSILKMR